MLLHHIIICTYTHTHTTYTHSTCTHTHHTCTCTNHNTHTQCTHTTHHTHMHTIHTHHLPHTQTPRKTRTHKVHITQGAATQKKKNKNTGTAEKHYKENKRKSCESTGERTSQKPVHHTVKTDTQDRRNEKGRRRYQNTHNTT